MNDELKQALLHWLDKIEGAVDKGGEFILEQAPLTVQQWIAFTVAENLAFAIFMLAIIIYLQILARSSWKQWGKANDAWKENKNRSSLDKDNIDIYYAFWSLAPMVVSGGCCIAFCYAVHNFLLAYLAPNVFILKELKHLIS